MKKPAILAAIIAGVLIVFYVSSLKNQLSGAAEVQAAYKKEISNLQSVKEGEAFKANSLFLQHFFNYSNIKQRNEVIKPLMTDNGFQMVYSGASENSIEVQTSAANLSSFEQKLSKNEAEFMNKFDLTISFNGVSNTDHVFVRTKFLYVKGEGWKSDSIEYIGEITRKAGETSE